MEILVVLFVGLAAVTAAATMAPRLRRAQLESTLDRWARAFGLRVVASNEQGGRLAGSVEGIEVQVDFERDDQFHRVRFTIPSNAIFPHDFRIYIEREDGVLNDRTLSEIFDADRGQAAAYVDGSLLTLTNGAEIVTIEDGALAVTWQAEAHTFDVKELDARLQRLAAWARRATGVEATTLERLANRAMYDPDSATRIRALRALRLHHPTTDLARSARRAGLDDPRPTVRIEAATRLGPDGLHVLAKIVETPTLPSTVRTSAMERLCKDSPRDHRREVLLSVAFDPDPDVAVYALQRLKEIADQATTDRVTMLARAKPIAPPTAVALSAYLGHVGGDEAIELLLAMLERSTELAVLERAAGATMLLGPNVVLRALEVLEPRKHPGATKVVGMLRTSIGDGKAGALAIARTDAAGALTVADDQRGALSDTPDDR